MVISCSYREHVSDNFVRLYSKYGKIFFLQVDFELISPPDSVLLCIGLFSPPCSDRALAALLTAYSSEEKSHGALNF